MAEPPPVLVIGRDPARRAQVVARLAQGGLAAVEAAPPADGTDAPALVVACEDVDAAGCAALKARWAEAPLLKLGPDDGLNEGGAADAATSALDAPEFLALASALQRLGASERRRARARTEFGRFSAMMPQMSWVTDPDGKALWFNDRWYAYTGADKTTIEREGSGKAWYHPDDAEIARARFLDCVRREASFEGEFRVRGRDGGYRWFLSRGEPMRDEAGRIVRWFGTHTDISDRREAEEALRVSEAAQRALIEGLPQLVWTCSTTGACDYVSPQWSAYTGHPAEALLGHGWAELALHPEDRERFRDHWRQVVGGEAGARTFAFEYRLKRHDNVWRWFATRGVAVEAADGSLLKWVGASADIHEEVEARRRLQQAAADRALELDRLHALSDDLFAVAEADGRVIAGNPAWERRFGYGPDDLVGKPLIDLLHPDDLAEGAARLAELVAGGAPRPVEVRVRTVDGRWRWISWTGTAEGGLLYAVGRDVTERRRAQEALEGAQEALRQSQKMEAIGQLTGGVAHDFNNLLTAITGNLELLQRRLARGRADVERYAEGALAGARRAATLTQRLLAFSRRSALAPANVDVNALAAGLEDLVRRTVGAGIQVRVLPAPGLPPAWCDPNQLENALLNLVINARDAMPEGGVLTIVTGEAPAPAGLAEGRYVSLTVCDTGEGMAPDVVAKAFEPFFTTKPLGQGTGLGLSQIYGFATQSGGAAVIDGRPGEGAAVSIVLPHRPEAAAVVSAPAEAMPVRAIGRGECILLVEDEAAVRDLVTGVLAEAGYAVQAEAEATSALHRLRGGAPIDLLLTDIGLPGVNGRRLADEARALRPGLPVLFVTGYEHDARHDEARAAEPGVDLLPKPFAVDVLLDRVGALIAWGRAAH